jgi:hypothetical protein
MADPKPKIQLFGDEKRVKLLPCPEGQSAGQGTIIGEVHCNICEEQRGGVAKCYVKLQGKNGRSAYAFHNTHHPESGVPCGRKIFSFNAPQRNRLVQAWTAQRYNQGTPDNAKAISPQPNSPQPKAESSESNSTQHAGPVVEPVAKPAAPKRAAVKPDVKPAGKPVDDQRTKPAAARPSTGTGIWD